MKYLLSSLLGIFCLPLLASAQGMIDIVFPVQGEVTFQDDFLDARSGHTHYATDIMAPKMRLVYAATDGVITFAPMSEPSYGYMLTLKGDDGFTYNYVHLNNDTPGTDDGNGGSANAYAAGIRQGARVSRGQHIAWVGDSGNAESVGPHLHFEIYDGQTPINPFETLTALYTGDVVLAPVVLGTSDSINDDKDIPLATGEVGCASDSLIRTVEVSTVYYCGRDGGRYVFQNESTFFSWYDNFNDVEYVTTTEMAAIPLRGVVTYKPGSYLVKILSSPKIYAVAANGTLRWVPSADLAESLYGVNWPSMVRDLPDSFWPAYTVGEDVNS